MKQLKEDSSCQPGVNDFGKIVQVESRYTIAILWKNSYCIRLHAVNL